MKNKIRKKPLKKPSLTYTVTEKGKDIDDEIKIFCDGVELKNIKFVSITEILEKHKIDFM